MSCSRARTAVTVLRHFSLVTGEPTEQKATPDASHTSLWCVVSDYK